MVVLFSIIVPAARSLISDYIEMKVLLTSYLMFLSEKLDVSDQ